MAANSQAGFASVPDSVAELGSGSTLVVRDRETGFQALVSRLPLGVFRKDAGGRFTFVNRALCRLLGKSSGDILGRTDSEVLPAAVAERSRLDDLCVLETGESSELDYPWGDDDESALLV